MDKDGLERMLEFLNLLTDKGIHFYLEQNAPDSLRVTMTLLGVRIEVVFFADHIEFSVFKGNEDVSRDEDLLYDLIKQNWD